MLSSIFMKRLRSHWCLLQRIWWPIWWKSADGLSQALWKDFTSTSVAFWLSCALGIVIWIHFVALVSTGRSINLFRCSRLRRWRTTQRMLSWPHYVSLPWSLRPQRHVLHDLCTLAPMAAMRAIPATKTCRTHSLDTASLMRLYAQNHHTFQKFLKRTMSGQMIPPEEAVWPTFLLIQLSKKTIFPFFVPYGYCKGLLIWNFVSV